MHLYYAKSKPDVLTIAEHTSDVVEAVQCLVKSYGHEISIFTPTDFELIEIAALYHDLGKYSDSFQNVIRASIDKGQKRITESNYPHNYLSTSIIPYHELKKMYSKEDAEIVVLAVGFHHERDIQPKEDIIKRFYNDYMEKHVKAIQREIQLPFDVPEKVNNRSVGALCSRDFTISKFEQSHWYKYILVKGLLQRADHAASAKRKGEDVSRYVEEDVESDVAEYTKAYLESNYTLRPLQHFTYNNQHKNIVLIAQTGSGKTEAALLWIGKKKGFFTLPLRASLNAMYNRIRGDKGIHFKSTGLLHSAALDHLLSVANEVDSFEQSIVLTDHTRLLAKKLTLSTIDQLFKFPLLYRGFETELATLAYSKVVIDEIQAYDAHIVAILIRGLELIHQLGGQWMIMTATLPEIFLDELRNKGLLDDKTLVETMLIPDDREQHKEMPRRHRIQLCTTIEDSIEQISALAKSAKVLVVVNTVKQALAVYDRLTKELQCDEPHLLHSQFTKKDRLPKEQEIKQFAQLDNATAGVWITTQIVEASLDVDFDYLFTEAATPDALFQRFGRCNRKGLRFNGEVPATPNVFIFTDLDEVSGINKIYERVIVENGLKKLSAFDGELIGELEKIEIVSQTFSRKELAGTDYLQKFELANKELESMRAFELKKAQAQEILRGIQSCLLVPGRENYEIVMDLIEQYEQIPKEIDAIEKSKLRKKLRLQIEQYTVSVNQRRLTFKREDERYSVGTFEHRDFAHIRYSTDVLYSEKRGLELTLDENFNNIC